MLFRRQIGRSFCRSRAEGQSVRHAREDIVKKGEVYEGEGLCWKGSTKYV